MSNCHVIKMYKFRHLIRYFHNLQKNEAIQFNSCEKTLEIIKKTIPQQDNTETVLIKIAYAGISGTDLKIISGNYPLKTTQKNIVPGHEICGVVCASAGEFEIGDKVVVNPLLACQVCRHCREKNEHYCPEVDANYFGIHQDGGWQNYCVVPTKQLYKIPANISLADAIFVYSISCVSHAWDLLKRITHGKKVLIIGAGFIGNLFAAFFHFNGHRNITICDENIRKLKFTVQLNTCYDLVTPNALNKPKNNNLLFDVIVDCSGDSKAMESAVSYLNYGGKFCIFGTSDAEAEIKISPYDIFKKELDIFASKLNPYSFSNAFFITESMKSRYLNYNKLGVKLFKMCEYKEALTCLRHGTISKGVFCFNEPENTEM